MHIRVLRVVLLAFSNPHGASSDEEVLRPTRSPSFTRRFRKTRLVYAARLARADVHLFAAVLHSSPTDPWLCAVQEDLRALWSRAPRKMEELTGVAH